MRGEICVSAASLLSLVAMLLMIFVHVGQINTSSVPRKIAMARVNVSDYSTALQSSFTDPFENIYTTNASAPLAVRAGLRNFYDFGLYSYCAYVNTSQGTCGNMTIGAQYRPYDAITSDMAANYSRITQALVQDTAFQSSTYLGESTKAAYWMLLLGTICALLATLTSVVHVTLSVIANFYITSGFLKTHFTFFLSTVFSVSGSGLLLIGASIWTIIIKKSDAVNDVLIGTASSSVPIGIVVTVGSGLYLTWAAFACLIVSVVPYMIRLAREYQSMLGIDINEKNLQYISNDFGSKDDI
ncbi:hypothetical protein DXG01_004245 [Tephrocybe rancida]|nr:hypothetical protein DXG01_004245 [Tephrocybe rancida]